MATYDHKQLLADYAAGRITPEMAVGHSLQPIAQLYETQAATRAAPRTGLIYAWRRVWRVAASSTVQVATSITTP
jgi:hypothetical protein